MVKIVNFITHFYSFFLLLTSIVAYYLPHLVLPATQQPAKKTLNYHALNQSFSQPFCKFCQQTEYINYPAHQKLTAVS